MSAFCPGEGTREPDTIALRSSDMLLESDSIKCQSVNDSRSFPPDHGSSRNLNAEQEFISLLERLCFPREKSMQSNRITMSRRLSQELLNSQSNQPFHSVVSDVIRRHRPSLRSCSSSPSMHTFRDSPMSEPAAGEESCTMNQFTAQRNCVVLQDLHVRKTSFGKTPYYQRNLSSKQKAPSSPIKAPEVNHFGHPNNSKSIASPWYRHCRPRAPEPLIARSIQSELLASSRGPNKLLLNLSKKRYCCESLRTSPELIIDQGSHCCDSHSNDSLGRLDTSLLEADTDQENRHCSAIYNVPWRPDSTPFSLGPYLSSYALADWSSGLTTGPVVLGPLIPITNLLLTPEFYATRQPKWSSSSRLSSSSTEPLNHRQSQIRLHDSDLSSAHSSSLPSPPPEIVERLPIDGHVTSHVVSDNYEEITNGSQLGSRIVTLARPTVKRAASDRIVSSLNSGPDISFAPKKGSISHTIGSLPTLTTKRFSMELGGANDYSPKKSRTQLLVPSEHSAFLPVASNASLQHSSFSPCVH